MATLLNNPIKRSSLDQVFSWSPTIPLQWELGVTSSGPSSTEITHVSKYELGITPSLNLLSEEEMFAEFIVNGKPGNSQLIILKDLSVDNGSLIYIGDLDILSCSVSESVMQKLFFTGYKTFLWAVRGVSENGVKSFWSTIRKFENDTILSNDWISISSYPDKVSSSSFRFNGFKNEFIKDIYLNGSNKFSKILNKTSWEAEVPLEVGLNRFELYGVTQQNSRTNIFLLEIEQVASEAFKQSIPNTFDHFGSLYGIERLFSIDETNSSFKSRIKDIFVHPAGANLNGLHNSIVRELNLNYDDYSIVLESIKNDYLYSEEVFKDLMVDITSNWLSILSRSFVKEREEQSVNNQDISVTLSLPLSFSNDDSIDILKVYNSSSIEIEKKFYTIDYDLNKIVFNSISFIGETVKVTYPYKIRTSLINKTLSSLVTDINTMSFNNRQILQATLSSSRKGSESSDGLLRQIINIRSNNRYRKNGATLFGHPLRWSDVGIFQLTDKEYWERFKSEDKSLLNTKIESYINEFKNKSHRTWNQVVLDLDTWDPTTEEEEDISSIPVLWDSIKGYWKSSSVSDRRRYSMLQGLSRLLKEHNSNNLLEWYGLKESEICSGIGRDGDLKVIIKEPTITEVLTEPDIYRATLSWELTGQTSDISFLPPSVYGSGLFIQ